MRLLVLVALLAVLVLGFPSPADAATGGPCQDLSVKRTITCAAKRWPVPGGPAKARQVAWCESRYNPLARNGRFHGVFQIGYDSEWPLWLSKFPVMAESWVRGIFDGRSNAIVAVRTAHRIHSWTPWGCA